MYTVYVLISQKDEHFYIGYTGDLIQRLKSHNAGKVRSTKARRPFELFYTEEVATIAEARQRENFLKSGQGRKWLKRKYHAEGWQSGRLRRS